MVMSSEAKEALLKRLKEGRAKTKAMREEAKAKGMPDPKPRKVRKDKKNKNGHAEPVDTKEALANPLSDKPAREEIRPIDGAKAEAKNVVAEAPVVPEPNPTTKIDVPNLPSEKGRKRIIKDAEVLPEVKAPKDLSTTGKTKKVDVNNIIVNEESGNQAIESQLPGQKESIKKLLATDKKKDTPLKEASNPIPEDKTVKNVVRHTPDVKAVEGRAPFSFSAVKKLLYQ